MTSLRSVVPFAFLFAGALLATACDAEIHIGDGESGSGDLVTETYDVGDFTAIEIESAFDVVIAVGDEVRVEVLADDNLVDDLDIRVRNGELTVGLKNGFSLRSGTLEATIHVPELRSLEMSGATEAVVTGLDASDFELELSGASDVSLEGTVQRIEIDASGSSNANIEVDSLDEADVDLSGASSVALATVNTVTGDISGASDISIPASASVNVDSSGASSIDRDE